MFEYDPEQDEINIPIESYAPEVQPRAEETLRLNPAQVSRIIFLFIEFTIVILFFLLYHRRFLIFEN